MSDGMGAIILKRNFYIKKRKAEAARSMYKVDLKSDPMSLTNDMWMSGTIPYRGGDLGH